MPVAAKGSGGIGELVRTVVYAGLVALGVRTIAFEPFNIPSGSMLPTLLIGDYLFVSKYSYGYSRHSLPFSLPLIPDRMFMRMPERGDVAVFKLPTDTSVDYIKRIIGLPGDRIQMIGGVLNINGEPVKRERAGDYVTQDSWGNVQRLSRYIETLPGGRQHIVIEAGDDGPLDNTMPYVVPPGHVFGMGDNRDNSMDSRVLNRVGYIPVENLVGRAEFLFFSTDGNARFWEVWNWWSATRFSRFFTKVE